MQLRLAKYKEEDDEEVYKEKVEDVREGLDLSDRPILGETTHIEHLGERKDGEKRHQDEKELGLGSWVPKKSRTQ